MNGPDEAPSPDDSIDIDGIPPQELLLGLYHGTRPLGLGLMHNAPSYGLVDAAADYAHAHEHRYNHQVRFDYVAGRPIKVTFDLAARRLRRVRLYDRDAGQGAAQAVVDRLRQRYPASGA